MATTLPWDSNQVPLMLAPMQGVTNRALRSVYYHWVRPDTLWTEFVRVGPKAAKAIGKTDQREITAVPVGATQVVQLVGHCTELLCAAACKAQTLGAQHLNLNLGCPYGRMTKAPTGGGLLRQPEKALGLIEALREVITGSFSVKLRSGYDDPRQILPLLPALERIGVDYLVLHPRTVVQQYSGRADHRLTAEVVAATHLPVIANGDLVSVEGALQCLRETGAAGLMLGRGALMDPLLFKRLRAKQWEPLCPKEQLANLAELLERLMPPYRELFCGEVQVLHKLKNVFALNQQPELEPFLKGLKKAKTLPRFREEIEHLRRV